jgi:hypothetical protein
VVCGTGEGVKRAVVMGVVMAVAGVVVDVGFGGGTNEVVGTRPVVENMVVNPVPVVVAGVEGDTAVVAGAGIVVRAGIAVVGATPVVVVVTG